jgi:Transposase IS116/IS110/IS902 family
MSQPATADTLERAAVAHVTRLTRDDIVAGGRLTDQEARYLVDAYYIIQEDRKRSANQVRALGETAEPNSILVWFHTQNALLENQLKRALDAYTKAHPIGEFMRSIHGIGPVLSAGLLAHIDISRCPTAGHLWSFAGWAGDKQKPWKKGEKKPFNGTFRTLLWKVGESFVKTCNSEESYYGALYKRRKEYEITRNEAGELAEQAAAGAARVNKSTEAYKHYSAGKLPPAHIHARARRYAVKQFLADLHAVWYRRHFGKEPPLPYPIAIMGHAHIRKPPSEPGALTEPTTASEP